MQPPLALPDADNPGFSAVNQAAALGNFGDLAANSGFDLGRPAWAVGASDARTALMENFTLKLTYRVTQAAAMNLQAPGKCRISFLPPVLDGDIVRSRTMMLSFAFELDAISALHVGGRDQDAGEPVPTSALHRCRLSAKQFDVRLLYTIATPALDESLRTRLTALYGDGTSGTLKRRDKPGVDVRLVDGARQPVPVPAEGDLVSRHLAPWWNGVSLASWDLTGSDAQNWLLTLQQNDSVVIQAMVRETANRAPTGHWFLCNPGYVLRALGVAGDQASPANDKAYRAISGGCVWPVATGGTLESGGTNPAGTTKLTGEDIFAIYGGSDAAVVFQPPSNAVVPGCLFTFTTAEDIELYSPRLDGRNVGLRIWQPTFDRTSLQSVRQTYGNAVILPADTEVILTTDYSTAAGEAPARALQYPEGLRDPFLVDVAEVYGYDGSRARPPAVDDPYDSGPLDDLSRLININATPEIRPEHRPWKAQRWSQIRRLFPLCLEGRDLDTTGEPILFLVTQDEVDCVRQEYVFHLKWTAPYYQLYSDQYDTPAEQTANVHDVGGPRMTFGDAGNVTGPSLGSQRFFKVPRRVEVRPLAVDDPALKTSYRYTLLMDTWRDRRDEVTGPGIVRATRIRAILDSASTRAAILAALGTNAYTDAVLPRWAAEVVALVGDMLANPEPLVVFNMRGFLCGCLTAQQTLARFDAFRANYEIRINSAWRGPEANESVSTVPNSNHQLGEAMDTAPANTWVGHRNPLAIFAHHLAAQTLWPGRLRELLLEDGATEFTMQVLNDESIRTLRYSTQAAPAPRKYYLNKPDGSTELVQGSANGKLSPKLLSKFFTDYGKYAVGTPNAWPEPGPTYLELYIYALTVASHVHLTWKRPP